MVGFDIRITRRLALLGMGALCAMPTSPAWAAEKALITVHKDPSCGCCSGWVEHLRKAGFPVTAIDTARLDAVKARLGVPSELAACHTAEVAGYVIEGHVPASAIERLLGEKPRATGLAVPGMPVGSPGMEGGTPEAYDVVLFGPTERRTYMRFIEGRAI
jgi:hypothetical protein